MAELKKGSKGDKVRYIQNVLNGIAFLQGREMRISADGDFGTLTENMLVQLFGKKTVSEADFNLAMRIGKTLVDRVKAMKAKGTSPEKQIEQFRSVNEKIFYNLLDIYAIWEKDPNRPANQSYYNQAWNIAARMNERWNVFGLSEAKSKLLTRKGIKAEYVPILKRLQQNGIGSIGMKAIVIPILVVIAPVPLLLGWGISEALADKTPDSRTDWKKSEEIKEILRKMDPKDREVLEEDVEQQLDQAYEAGYNQGKPGFLSSIFKGGSTMLIGGSLALAAVFLLPKVINKK